LLLAWTGTPSLKRVFMSRGDMYESSSSAIEFFFTVDPSPLKLKIISYMKED
jgi:hypothetical protein